MSHAFIRTAMRIKFALTSRASASKQIRVLLDRYLEFAGSINSEDIGRTGRGRSRLTPHLRLALGGWRSRFQLLGHSDKAESGATVPRGIRIQGDYA